VHLPSLVHGRIRTSMEPLPTDITVLQALVRQLQAENAALKAELAALKARLQADSHNSHQPPSADGLRKRPALPQPVGRKRGGQPGHPGKTLTMVAHPDTTIPCPPPVCACGASLQDVPGTVIERRQVFDLPEPKLAVTEYQRLRCQCPKCGMTQDGAFPPHVTAPTQYGPGVLALATLLNTGYRLPFNNIQGIFADLFGATINEQTLVRANATCYEALAPSEAVIQGQLSSAPVCHFDETGIRVAGTLHWQHVVSSPSATYLFVHPNRGAAALNSPSSLLPTYHGWAVHDCWPSYFGYAACHHALCGAHLLRELTGTPVGGADASGLVHPLSACRQRQRDRDPPPPLEPVIRCRLCPRPTGRTAAAPRPPTGESRTHQGPEPLRTIDHLETGGLGLCPTSGGPLYQQPGRTRFTPGQSETENRGVFSNPARGLSLCPDSEFYCHGSKTTAACLQRTVSHLSGNLIFTSPWMMC